MRSIPRKLFITLFYVRYLNIFAVPIVSSSPRLQAALLLILFGPMADGLYRRDNTFFQDECMQIYGERRLFDLDNYAKSSRERSDKFARFLTK